MPLCSSHCNLQNNHDDEVATGGFLSLFDPDVCFTWDLESVTFFYMGCSVEMNVCLNMKKLINWMQEECLTPAEYKLLALELVFFGGWNCGQLFAIPKVCRSEHRFYTNHRPLWCSLMKFISGHCNALIIPKHCSSPLTNNFFCRCFASSVYQLSDFFSLTVLICNLICIDCPQNHFWHTVESTC